LASLFGAAEKAVNDLLSGGLDKKLSELADYMTLGVDSQTEVVSKTQNYIGQPHAELVAIVDLRDGMLHWTGKSYPTTSQQGGLIRVPDLKTHFLELPDAGKLMVLGCHDLTVFNPRSKNATGWRGRVRKEFRGLAKNEGPKIVLQHPHTSDSVLTWRAAWNGLIRDLPSVRAYASAGRYYNEDGQRSKLDDVLEKTKLGDTLDFIVR